MKSLSSLTKKYCVFMPCYNGAKTISETIESVNKALKFANLDFPVFIYDDCSTDESVLIIHTKIKDLNNFILIRNNTNLGQWDTKNKAFSDFQDKFDWVFLLHADDIAKQEWIFELVQLIESKGESCFSVWSSYDVLKEPSKKVEFGESSGSIIFNAPLADEKERLSKANDLIKQVSTSWHISGAAINIHKWHELGVFDQQFTHYGDSDIWIRSKLNGMGDLYLAKSLILYRQHFDSVSAVTHRTNRDLKEIFLFLSKYNGILVFSNKTHLLKKIITISFRRLVKSLINAKIKGMTESISLILKSCKKYLQLLSSL